MAAESLTPFGERVEALRAKRGLSKQGLAQLARVSRVHLWRATTGRSALSAAELERLAAALQVPVTALAPGAVGESEVPPTTGAEESSEGGVTPERTELDPATQRAARRLVDAFKREAALGGATPEELHYIETVLMTPNLPPTLAGGSVRPDRLLEHIQAMMEPLRALLRDLGRHV